MAPFNPRSGREVVRSRDPKREEQAFVRFENATEMKVDMVWVDYDGAYITMRTLPRNTFVDINTFTCHPWKAIATDSLEEMALNQKPVYHPKTPRALILELAIRAGRHRTLPNDPRSVIRPSVIINRPLYSLLEVSMNAIIKCLSDPEDADQLELPAVLAKELRAEIVHRKSIVRVFDDVNDDNNR